jgi:phage tail sheath protein FI
MPAYNTPGVYIEEISGGPRPIQASSTTDTGFVGVVTLPKSFLAGKGKAVNMFLPATQENAQLTWNRALAFRRLLTTSGSSAAEVDATADKAKAKAKPAPKSDNRLRNLVDELMDGKWDISTPVEDENNITLTSDKGQIVRFPARRTIFSSKTKSEGEKTLTEWDMSFAADDQSVMELIATHAGPNNVGHSGTIEAADTTKSITIDVEGIQGRMQKAASMLTSMDSYEQWRRDLGQELFMEILMEGRPDTSEGQAEALWETLSASARKSWDDWLRSHPGMRRLEIGIRGFFENGGQTAFVTLAFVESGKDVSNKRKFLEDSFDGISAVAMLAAPGLDFSWQNSILEYAGPAGRGDLFAVLEAPRYFLTKNPRNVKLSPFRWTDGDAPYEVQNLQTMATPQSAELRFSGYAADELLDRAIPRDTSGYGAAYAPWLIVDNPLSTGPHDRFVVAPPSGHVAGVIAATDLKPGGGVHKAPANEQVLGVADLVTEVSDKEQGVLNIKGVNIIRHRPFAGIRIWGARTIASDPLWNYINVRRLFLMVERSVRDAIQWAVFLPNVPATRADLKSTIAAFLYRLWKEGALDGATWGEAFSVTCDANNNPDVDVRSGLLTVDVQMRPVFPAEFIRVRFRQSPMRSEVSE